MVGNLLFMLIVLSVHGSIVFLVYFLRKSKAGHASWVAAAGTCRFPSYSFLPTMFFYQSTLESSVNVLLHEPMGGRIVALLCIIGFQGTTAAGLYYVLKPGVFTGVLVEYPNADPVMRFLVGAGDYASPKDSTYVEQ
eukprot:TRINITY_DN8002_c0_g2_i1.p2 TRINITY_DN8002_c0_g2~~TRINITY_DN8002_c0_g2_i1.p2  ORF type:complete len:137 (+),score=10.67 TRINITY_DN8002_c0_g2_i1:282-692(+)